MPSSIRASYPLLQIPYTLDCLSRHTQLRSQMSAERKSAAYGKEGVVAKRAERTMTFPMWAVIGAQPFPRSSSAV